MKQKIGLTLAFVVFLMVSAALTAYVAVIL